MKTHTFGVSVSRLVCVVALTAVLAACDGESSSSVASSASAASLSGTPTAIVAANTVYSFRPQAAVPAGTSMVFSIENKPAWASFSLTSGQLSGTPISSDTGEYPNIKITASDGTTTAALPVFGIKVTPAVAIASNPGSTITTTSPTSAAASTSTATTSTEPSTSTSSTTSSTTSPTTSTSSTKSSSSSTKSSSSSSTSSSSSSTSTSTEAATVDWTAPSENTDGTALTNLAGYTIYYGTSASSMTTQVSITTVGELDYVVQNLGAGTWYFEVVAVNTAGVQSNPSNVVSVTL